MLLIAGLAVVVAAISWRRPAAPAVVPAEDQNILLITIDTLRADALGAYGGAAATPNLDKLAQEGVRFDFAHAHAVVTLPSHASILTGHYPFEHGIRDNSGYRLPPQMPTLAAMLKAAGYSTGAFIAAFPLAARFGLNQGFDVYDDERVADVSGPADFRMAERAAPDVIARATSWIRKQPGRWFAWVHLFEPHAPYQPPAPYDSRYAGSPYHGEVAYTDAMLGALLDLARGQARPTLVVVTSDHGEALGDHGELTHGLFAYESTLRVPLIVAQVGAGRAGRPGRARVSQTPARHVDLVPTILEAVSVQRPGDLSGRSLLPTVDGSSDDGDRSSYFEAMSSNLNRGWAPLLGVLAEGDKFIDLPLPEVYALGNDPGEQQNLVAREPARLRGLEARLKVFAAPLPAERTAEPPAISEQLRALGYVSGSARLRAVYAEEDDPKRLVRVDQLLHGAIDDFQHGKIAEAVAAYRKIIAARPDMAIAYRHLAFIQWETGDVPGALATLREALGRGAHEIALRVQLGTYLAQSGRAGEAIPLLERAIGEHETDVEARNALGIAYGQGGRTREAIGTFEEILAREPHNAMALENLGALHLQSGNLAAARQTIERALELNASSSRAHTSLGVVAMRQGNRSGAVRHWQTAVELDPSEFDALFNLASELTAAGRRAEARPYLERFAATAPPALYAGELARVRALLQR